MCRLTASKNHLPNCHLIVKVKEKYNIPRVCSGKGPNKSTTLPDNNGGAPGRCWRYSFDLNQWVFSIQSAVYCHGVTLGVDQVHLSFAPPSTPFRKNLCEGRETALPQRIKKTDFKQKEHRQRGQYISLCQNTLHPVHNLMLQSFRFAYDRPEFDIISKT